MATGDITVTILADGVTADLAIAGFTLGATYAFGLTATDIPGASTPSLSITSLHYTAGVADTGVRTSYLTATERFPFGTVYLTGTAGAGTFTEGETITQATSGATGIIVGRNQGGSTRLYFRAVTGTFDNSHLITGGTSGATFTSSSTITTPTLLTTPFETLTATGITIRVSLSHPVFQKDNTGGGNSGTAPTVTIPAAFATNTGGGAQTSNALAAAAVTQNSTLAFPLPFAQWAQRPFDRWQSNPTLSVTARHFLGIDSVSLILTDTHAHTVTTACAKQANQRATSGLYAEEWTATPSLTTLTQGDVITARYQVYPTYGDAPFDSNTAAVTTDTVVLGQCNYTYYNDKNATADVYAVVSSAGNDATGVSSATLATAAASPYLTIGKALTIGTANVIYLRSGSVFNVLGSAVTKPSDFGYWRQVKVYPGDAATTVELTGTATYNTPKLSYEGLNYRLNTGANWFDGSDGTQYLSFKSVVATNNGIADNGTVSGFGYRSAAVFFSNVSFNDASKFGLGDDFAARIAHWFDGCTFTASATTIQQSTYRLVACYSDHFGFQSSDNGATTAATSDPMFIEFNKIMNYVGTSSSCLKLFTGTVNISTGISVTGNVIETAASTQPSLQLSADNNTNTVAHACIWNNTIPGERANLFYNETGTVAKLKNCVSIIGNCFGTSMNIKSDNFGTQNGNRTGNWSELMGTTMFCNATKASIGFNPRFVGLGSGATMDTVGETNGNAAICTMAFTSNASVTGTGAGNGDYTLTAGSACLALVVSPFNVVGFDLTGKTRAATDNAGAYATGIPTSTSTRIPSIPSIAGMPSIGRR